MQYVKAGTLTYEEAANKGHTLRSALTGEEIAMIDAPPTPYPLLPGDRIIMTSDGTDDLLLVPILSEKTRALLSNREGNLATAIVEACVALESPYADNVTVVCMDW
jgi:protein phosphatase